MQVIGDRTVKLAYGILGVFMTFHRMTSLYLLLVYIEGKNVLKQYSKAQAVIPQNILD